MSILNRTMLAIERRRKGLHKLGSAPTSDTRRGMVLAAAALVAIFSVGIGSLLVPDAKVGPGSLTPPHRARLSCETCHGKQNSQGDPAFLTRAREACQNCHGEHRSLRAGHARLMSNGDLRCTTCHTIHRSQEGVRIDEGGLVTRYSDKAEREVGTLGFVPNERMLIPLVSTEVCQGCHSGQKQDPAARCAPSGFGKGLASMCFDEHQQAAEPTVASLGGPAGQRSQPQKRALDDAVCSTQHFPDRALAWETARQAAVLVPSLATAQASSRWTWLLLGAVAASLCGAMAVSFWFRGRRLEQPHAIRVPVASRTRKLPVINPSTCLGCYACVDACPYSVLEVANYVAVVARPDACCGLVLCEDRCPNGSLKVAEHEALIDLPALDDNLMSKDVPGVFLAGDITGLPLIKNAMLQGRHAAQAAIQSLLPGRDPTVPDLVIVGGGPAGLAAALRAKELGKSAVILEQGIVAESIRNFPRGKLIFDQPLELPLVGSLWLKESTKEELLLHWTRILRKENLDIREQTRMVRVSAEAGSFQIELQTAQGLGRIRAHRIVLAIGRRGTPRLLNVPISEGAASRIYYHLADAQSLDRQQVVVVGLGDTAMEAAIALASARRRQMHAPSVTILHRGATYSRGQPRNIEELERLRKAGRVQVIFSCIIQQIEDQHLLLAGGRRIPFDVVIALIGNLSPRDALAHAGIHLAPRPAEEPKNLTQGLVEHVRRASGAESLRQDQGSYGRHSEES